MKRLITLIVFAIIVIFLMQQESYSQTARGNIRKDNIQQKKSEIKSGNKTKVKTFKKFPNPRNSGVSNSFVLKENFESGVFPPNGWYYTGGYPHWFLGYNSGYGTGNHCALYEFYNFSGSNSELYSSTFLYAPAGDTLSFDYAYTSRDGIYDDLEIIFYNGAEFQYAYITGSELQTAPDNSNYFNPASNEWGTFYVIIPNGAISIIFRGIENGGNNLYIDNIVVTGPPFTDVAVTAAYSKGRYPRTFLSNDTISANLRNTGNQEINNLKVYMRMTGASNLFDSTIVTNVPPFSDYEVKFKPFTPVLNGNSSIKIWVQGGDENINNDTGKCITNVNSNYYAYTDTTENYYGSIGTEDNLSLMQKFRVTNANSRITEVKVKIHPYATNSIGQGIKGIVLNGSGTVVAKSDEYKIKASDLGTLLTLKLTNPRPYYPLTNNSYFYAGAELTDVVGLQYYNSLVYVPENPIKPGAHFLLYGLKNIGETAGTLYEYGKIAIETKIENMPTVDAGISVMGNLYDQYYNTTTAPMSGKVFNNALTGTANATVIRKITPGAYTSSVAVSIPANSTIDVNFSNFTFTPGTVYTVRDSVILAGDVNLNNNSMSREYTPRIAKQLAVIYQKDEDKDSLERAILEDGRYVNNYDLIDLNYTGTYRTWKIIFNCTKTYSIILPRQRDSLKSFIDNSTPGDKKSLIVFGDNQISYEFSTVPADTVFVLQYLKAKYVSYNWITEYYKSESKFRGTGFFSGISQDSVSPSQPDYANVIKPVNGSSAAFVPKSLTGPESETAIAVSYAGTNFNSFFMTSRFSDLRATNESPLDGPILVYSKIIDWIQSVNTGVKVLDLTIIPEGLYNEFANSITRDTVKVYIRNSTTPFAIVDSGKAYLSSSGQASILFNNVVNGVNYYIQVKHRNSMETWSGTPQMFSSNQLTYDFTSDSYKAYGDNMKFLTYKWVIFAGDVTDFGAIDATDISSIDASADIGESGYVTNDLNNDYFVDASDISLCDNNASVGIYLNSPGPSPSLSYGKVAFNNPTNSENKIDHEIYDKTKNMTRKESNLQERKIIISNNGRTEYKILK